MNDVLTVTVEAHDFAEGDFVGGDAALDFINTVTGRDQTPRDWIDSYARMLEWAKLAALLPDKQVRALARMSEEQPTAAARALTRAKQLREQMFAVVSRIARGSAPPKDALAQVQEHWLAGAAAHELRFSEGRIVTALRADASNLDLISSIAAYRLVEHVLSLPTDRLRMCAGPNCSWVFIDSSKAGRRRWCDMAVCGNTAKARRFYDRTRRQ
jgi:predicted RNA-binding Zn ribbon-like protein